ncbi:hypothetical protein MR642_04880 [bacterium]|nr:hypothetical protein [bacterium]
MKFNRQRCDGSEIQAFTSIHRAFTKHSPSIHQAFTERSPSVHGCTAAQHLQRNKCECLKIQTFTPFPLKINGKRGVGEGVNAFYRE